MELKKIIRKKRQVLIKIQNFFSLLIFIFLIIALIKFLFLNDYFKIKEILCYKEKQICLENERKLFADILGENIFLLDINKKINYWNKLFPGIKVKNLKKILPNKIHLQLEIKNPLVALENNGKSWWLIDDEGFVLNLLSERPQNLPLIKTREKKEIYVGKQISEENLKKSFKLLKLAKEINLEFLELEVDSNMVVAKINNKTVAVFSLKKKLAEQVNSLQFILRQSKIEGRIPESIDLRFEKVIIRY